MKDKIIVIKRNVKVPVEKVWEAWTVPLHMKEWFSAESLITLEVKADVFVGGEHMIHMGRFYDTGLKDFFKNKGVYKAIYPMRLLVFTWQWENDPVVSEVSVELNKISDSQTELVLTHVFPDEKAVGMHSKAWEGTLNKLVKYLDK